MPTDVTRLIATMIGALTGVALGLYGLITTFRYYEDLVSTGGAGPIIAVVVFCGGGLVGGGYLALSLHMWWERVARRKKDAQKTKYGRKSKSKNKGKKKR